jgi:hypothetical protein
MALHIVMDATGDTRHEFDAADAKALRRAEARFRELTGRGFRAVALHAGGTGTLLRQFDPQVERTLFMPQLSGG